MSRLKHLLVRILCIFSIKARQYMTEKIIIFSKDGKYQEETCIAMGLTLKIVQTLRG